VSYPPSYLLVLGVSKGHFSRRWLFVPEVGIADHYHDKIDLTATKEFFIITKSILSILLMPSSLSDRKPIRTQHMAIRRDVRQSRTLT
jgi:hypothetical protein